MEQVTGLLTSKASAYPVVEPRLLVEPEARYRVFLDNLADLVLFRSLPPVPTTSAPGIFWRDVFVPSPISWGSFVESMLWHSVAVVAVWAVSAGGHVPKTGQFKQANSRASLYYYPPSKTFSARTSSAPRSTPARHESPRQAAMRVAREQRRTSTGGAAAPDARVAGRARTPNLGVPNPTMPSAPLAAMGTAKLTLPSDWTSVVAPPPDLSRARGRRGGLSQTSVVEPPPDVGGVSSRRALNGPSGGVIEPPPSVQDSLHGNNSPFGDGHAGLSAGSSHVVPPPPSVQEADGSGRGVKGLAGVGGSVVPPPPSVLGEGRGGSGRLGALAGGGSQVVPPPPSIQGAGNGGAGRLASLSGGGSAIVPPPPSVQGVGNGGGGRGVGSLASGGSPIVPPPPSMQGNGHGSGGRLGALGGGGSAVVPPPPSVQGSGHGGSGRLGALAGGGLTVIPPPPSLQGTGTGGGGTGSGGSGRNLGPLGGGGSQVVPPPPTLQGAGGAGAGDGGSGRGLGSLAGGGLQVVPPPPTVQVAGNGGGGRGMGSLGGGSGVVPPPPSMGGAGGNGGARLGSMNGSGTEVAAPPSGSGSGMYSGSTGPLAPMDALPTDAPNTGQPAVPQEAPGEDVPLRLVSMAMPTPGSSFFSNYEVYIAERRVRKGTTELIKLVYAFLPYQKRLSEYVQNNAKVYTLRVLRDPSCDESLMQMTWSEADQPTGDPSTKDLISASDKKSQLPCYRTTAEDYQRALDRGR